MSNQFIPDYAISPGEILEDELEMRDMSQRELSEKTGISTKHISQIINAKAPITPETALKFERVLGMPARYWLNLETQYQEALTRIADKEKLSQHAEWVKQFPLNELYKCNFISKYTKIFDKVDAILRFFGVSSPDDYHTVWGNISASYRQDQRSAINPHSCAAWLRAGELKATEIPCVSYSETNFKQALQQIKRLTREVDPDVFIPQLVEICAKAGVAVVFVPCFAKTGISGATRWVSPNKAVIQLSLRYKTNDHLWFTFFHEAGHVLLHGKKTIHLEYNRASNLMQEENEANEFAQKNLIPRTYWHQIIMQPKLTESYIRTIAAEIGIAEGIIVGQLQHHNLLQYHELNHLKVSYRWQ
ncbi:addiction module antidote protein, HigA family [Actinobacillus succinogenes]|nr:HigA family addiction module antitoxin [Actinobacillus succinogenes]PHI41002.1 addiction module antidote protein, HigA family [Actinobacillus succinogenes]